MVSERIVEGVPYHRYVVSVRLKGGRRYQRILWSPGYPWVQSEARRLVEDIFWSEDIASVGIRERPL